MADAEAGSLQFAVEKWGKHLIEHGFKKSQKHVRWNLDFWSPFQGTQEWPWRTGTDLLEVTIYHI